MATAKNTPGTKSTEQRGQDTSFGNTAARAKTNSQPGDRATTDQTRNTDLPGMHHKDAETTQAGTNDRNTGSGTGTNKMAGERTDREAAGARTKGQNPTGARDTNAGELRDEDEEDAENLPTSEDVDAEEENDEATADDDGTTNAK